MENITKSEELYLITILYISEKKDKIRCSDIARYLGYTRASSLGMLRKLKEKNLVYFDEKKKVHLTDEGLKIAKTHYKRVNIFKIYLQALGADEKVSLENAKNIELALTEEMLDVIDNGYSIEEIKNKYNIL